MEKRKMIIIDIDYITNDDKAVVRLFGKTKGEKEGRLIHGRKKRRITIGRSKRRNPKG